MLVDAIEMGWDLMIGSWDWLVIGWAACIGGTSLPQLAPVQNLAPFISGIFGHNFWIVGGSGDTSSIFI